MSASGPAVPARAGSAARRYVVYLVCVALAGWALASYDLNLLVLALPAIAHDLAISETGLGMLGFFVFGAQFVITLFTGYAMDRLGRRRVWMFCLTGTAIFTGLTALVNGFWSLVLVRAIASGLAYSELAVSITIVNEQLPARGRGFLYSIVQGGWPLGVFLASGVYLAAGGLGWRLVFLFGILPIVAVILGRIFIRESDRFEHERALRPDDQQRITLRELFLIEGPIRRQLVLLSASWIFYGISYVATNFYITYWLTTYKGYSGTDASKLLLVSGGIGFFFYIVGGALGERFGRRSVLIWSGLAVAPLTVLFYFAQSPAAVAVIYFVLYQATNGTWSGAGYAYQGESFPTRIRGSAVGFLSAMGVLGFVLGSLLWTWMSFFGNPGLTWFVVATASSLGMWLTLLLRPIPPGLELEEIAA
ncbi:MFS transporter [Lichenicoccus roseus]|uniref:MFS transporter n=1 Tax=Lichenicoccus roseus TaxID=2683649 RepID=A0A5R9J3C4_9PROT|nr:MFS transporter [Lichenicoccus roseus]TLU71343.1 MFS transporter [Lichenicoccus roseus]